MTTSTSSPITVVGTPPSLPKAHDRYVFVRVGMILSQVVGVQVDGKMNVRSICDAWGAACLITDPIRQVNPDEVFTIAQMRTNPQSIVNEYDDCLTNMREYLLTRIAQGSNAVATMGLATDIAVLATICGNTIPDRVLLKDRTTLVSLSMALGDWLKGLPHGPGPRLTGRFVDGDSVRQAVEWYADQGFIPRMKEEIIATADSVFHHSERCVVLY